MREQAQNSNDAPMQGDAPVGATAGTDDVTAHDDAAATPMETAADEAAPEEMAPEGEVAAPAEAPTYTGTSDNSSLRQVLWQKRQPILKLPITQSLRWLPQLKPPLRPKMQKEPRPLP